MPYVYALLFIGLAMSIVSIGLDLSLRSTGYAVAFDGVVRITGAIMHPKLRGPTRLLAIVDDVMEIVRYQNKQLRKGDVLIIAIEGYAMRAKGRVMDIAELGGLVKLSLYEYHPANIWLVPPSSLKLFATGKGNADKDMMRASAGKDSGTYFRSNDEADAYWLSKVAFSLICRRTLPRLATNPKRLAVAKCSLYE